MQELFYLLAGVSMVWQTAIIYSFLSRVGARGKFKDDDEEGERQQRDWNEGFRALMGYDFEKAKRSVRDNGKN